MVDEKEVEGETLTAGDDGEKGDTPISGNEVEGETPVVSGVGVGETPVESDEGETLVHGGLDGETPIVFTEGETPIVKNSEGETPIVFAEGETPVVKNSEGETPSEVAEGETPMNIEVQEPDGGGLTEIVDLVNVPEDEDTPIKNREARRMARRSLVDEADEPTHPRRLEFRAPGVVVEMEDETPGSGNELKDAEERRLAAERKRKGKHAATIPPKRSRKAPSVERVKEPLTAATKVPYAKEFKGPSPDSEPKEEEDEEQEEELNYKRAEVWITKKLLKEMGEFDNPRRAQTYKERSAPGKLAKSGKQYDPKALREIESDKEFLKYISAIGFEWLMNHSTAEVPTTLAREFFSTFRLKSTTDLDADSITFRLFNEEYEMSIR
ncbi:uncharacterized protein LOC121767059 [Salvia splendens]|uniref:uncharacterized protein LOC121767059 n=1 Tax=Salvia splendens TaxID=180675 RepID=UPI001C259CAA|nr:uncharacterized protein LOC121767059 [Salvia splendens]